MFLFPYTCKCPLACTAGAYGSSNSPALPYSIAILRCCCIKSLVRYSGRSRVLVHVWPPGMEPRLLLMVKGCFWPGRLSSPAKPCSAPHTIHDTRTPVCVPDAFGLSHGRLDTGQKGNVMWVGWGEWNVGLKGEGFDPSNKKQQLRFLLVIHLAHTVPEISD